MGNLSINHFSTNNHLQKKINIEQIRATFNSKKKPDTIIYCSICNLLTNSSRQLSYHLKCESHKKNFEKYTIFFSNPNRQENIKNIFGLVDFLKLNQDLTDIYSLMCENSNYGFIKSQFDSNSILLQNCVRYLGSIQIYSIYKIGSQIELDSSFDEILSKNELNNCVPKRIIGDGNCFYRSIAYLILGDEKYYLFIKMCCIYMLIYYKDDFDNYDQQTQESTVNKIERMVLKNEWANETSLITAALLLDRPIFTFSIDTKNSDPLQLKYQLRKIDTPPILIGFKVNHYIAILQKEYNAEIKLLRPFDMNFEDYFKIKQF